LIDAWALSISEYHLDDDVDVELMYGRRQTGNCTSIV